MSYSVTHYGLVVLGSRGVGKTVLISRLIDDGRDYHDPTLEDRSSKMFVIGGENYLVGFEECNNHQYAAIKDLLYRNAHGFLILYDISSQKSFQAVTSYWEDAKKMREKNGRKVFGCVVGNKSDLRDQRTVSFDEGRRLADGLGCVFVECSAKTWDNIETAVFDLIRGQKKQT